MRRHAFRAMGTEISVLLDDETTAAAGDRAIGAVADIFAAEEQRCSRFRPDSELSMVNASAGSTITVSAPLADLLRFSLRQAAESAGLFDPTVLGAVVAAGYDRDFDEVIAGARDRLHPPVACGRWGEVELQGRELRLPRGVGVDLGGVAKGWTVDLAAVAAVAEGVRWVVVNAGGDLRVAGDAPPVEVAIDDPAERGSSIARLSVAAGAVATSSTARRAWGPGARLTTSWARTAIAPRSCSRRACPSCVTTFVLRACAHGSGWSSSGSQPTSGPIAPLRCLTISSARAPSCKASPKTNSGSERGRAG